MKMLNNEEIEKMIESGELVKEIEFCKIIGVGRSTLQRYRNVYEVLKRKYNKKYIYESKFTLGLHYIYYKSNIFWFTSQIDNIKNIMKEKASLIEVVNIE